MNMTKLKLKQVGKKKADKVKVAKERETEAERQKREFDVEFYRDWCKGCGICAAFCPTGALSMNDKGEPEITKPELCTGCAWCEIRCPDFAVSVREQKEEACEV